MHIIFDKNKHLYYNNNTKDIYISTTQILSRYKKAFDRDGNSLKVAKREGISQQEVLDRWEKNKNDACIKGTNYHLTFEQYIQTNYKNPEYDSQLYDAFDKQFEPFKYAAHKHTEMLLYNDEFKIAGTCDLLIDLDTEFSIIDFKTNKKLNTSNFFGDYLQYPVDYLQNCEYNVYALQLSFYAYMYEKMTNRRVKSLCIYYINDNNIIPFYTPYLKLEVIAILQNYKKNKL